MKKMNKDFHITGIMSETFRQHRESLLAAFLKYINSFEEKQKNLVNIQSRIILPDESSMSVFNACDIGIEKCLQFRKDRLVTNKVSLYDHITLNKLPLFHQRNTSNDSYTKRHIKVLKENRRLFSNLHISCQ